MLRNKKLWWGKGNSGFSYDHQIDYSDAASFGKMDSVCRFCSTLTWKNESKGICGSSGKVALPRINEAPEPLASLFRKNIRNHVIFLTI